MASVVIYWQSGSHKGNETLTIPDKLNDKQLSRRIGDWGRLKKNRKKVILKREVKLGAS